MGSVFGKETKSAKQPKNGLRSKCDRLGWKSYKEVEHVPLRDVLTRGEVVSSSYCFMSCNFKLIP